MDRRDFVSFAGLGLSGAATTFQGANTANIVDAPNAGDRDVTAAINAALGVPGDVFLPGGTYRVDSTVIVPKHTRLIMSHGSTLIRASEKSENTDAVVAVLGNRAGLCGGRIVTENPHPRGIVVLGHADNTKNTRYNATNWSLSDCSIEGQQAAGNVGIWIPNSQSAHKTTEFANYFGFVQNVAIRGSDIGILLDEVANAHRFFGVFFSHLISSAWELRGAYANQVFGGFLHQSKNGVVGIRLRNTSNEKYHDSIYNSFFGFGIEPGGATSSAYQIDSRCRRNTLILQSNVPGKSVDKNGENQISKHGGDWPLAG